MLTRVWCPLCACMFACTCMCVCTSVYAFMRDRVCVCMCMCVHIYRCSCTTCCDENSLNLCTRYKCLPMYKTLGWLVISSFTTTYLCTTYSLVRDVQKLKLSLNKLMFCSMAIYQCNTVSRALTQIIVSMFPRMWPQQRELSKTTILWMWPQQRELSKTRILWMWPQQRELSKTRILWMWPQQRELKFCSCKYFDYYMLCLLCMPSSA